MNFLSNQILRKIQLSEIEELLENQKVNAYSKQPTKICVRSV